MTSISANGKAITLRKFFSRETSVSLNIRAGRSTIWNLLTDAGDYPRWNATVVKIKGTIAPGEKITLTASLDPTREFKLKVKEFDVANRLTWGDAMGNRVYTLRDAGEGLINFSMSERIAGPLFPLFARMIPAFDDAFESFARDLKRESEMKSKSSEII